MSTPAKNNLGKNAAAHWTLRLYVAAQTPEWLTALANLKRICEEHLTDQYRIDRMANPQLAVKDQILAIPTLVRKMPGPVRKLIGDLSSPGPGTRRAGCQRTG